MAVKFRHKARVSEDGKLEKIYSKRSFYQDLRLFAGKDITIEISKHVKSRSTNQNAYYWSVVINCVIDGLVDAGYERYKLSTETVHEFLKEKFLKEDIASEQTGEVLSVTKSTSDLSTVEFMDYIANIQQWASTYLSITIPDPGQQGEMNL